MTDRGRRLRRAGRRRRDHPPRAGASISWSARRAITGCRSCSRAPQRGEHVVDTEFPVEDKFDVLAAPTRQAIARARHLRLRHRAGRLRQVLHVLRRALYARRRSFAAGGERSSPKSSGWRDAGVREVTLIGQNVNAYHGEGPDGAAWTLGRLLHRLAEVPGIARLRYTTSHPRDMDDDLIAAHRDLPRADALSAPAGAVGLRPHPRGDEPQAHARRLSRRRLRGCARRGPTSRFPSDFIVGFPGESEADFRPRSRSSTRSAIAGAFSFKYSPRPGTPAAEMDDQVPERVKTERLQRLQAAIDAPSGRLQRRALSAALSTCCSRSRARHAGQLVGRSPYLQPVQVMAPAR